jgi:hypothetical protein
MFWTIQYHPDRRHAQILPCEKARFHIGGHEASLRPIVAIIADDQGFGGEQRTGLRSKVQCASSSYQFLYESGVAMHHAPISKANLFGYQNGSRTEAADERSRQAANYHDGTLARPFPAR